MSNAETPYSFRAATPFLLEAARDQVSALAAYHNGAVVPPDDGTVTLRAPGGTVLVDARPFVVNASDVAEVAYTAADLPSTLTLGEGYTEEWTFNMPDGTTRRVRRYGAVGLFELHPPIDDTLITAEYPDIVADLGEYATNLQGFIDAGWRAVIRTLTRHASWPHIVVDPSDVYDLAFHETCFRIFRALFKSPQNGDRWERLFVHHSEAADAARAGLAIVEDRNQDGLPDSYGKRAVVRTVHINVPEVASPLNVSSRWG